MIHRRGSQSICSLCLGSSHLAILCCWTYPVLAKVALTPTHTATKTAGRPVCTENNGMVVNFAPNPMTFLSSLPHPSPYTHGLFNATLTT